ncbi:hypothetical protein QUW56_03260 [Phocaeicola barnesiae]|uniref:hypothetical protein n=1 Tax=Phocaeicola barnesiae TaxID=376804 RepID=UPI0025A42953|nr:hypothetical protein [Phocaeicola barnesiae]MDM8232412.1 hypothetical protein [Phocaeicola barnesiae]
MSLFAYYNYQFARIVLPPVQGELFTTNAPSIHSNESFARKQEILSEILTADCNGTRRIVFKSPRGRKKHLHSYLTPYNDGMAVIKISNHRVHVTDKEDFMEESNDEYPSCIVVINNRPGIQRIVIEKSALAFADVDQVQAILQSTLRHLLRPYGLSINIDQLKAQVALGYVTNDIQNYSPDAPSIKLYLPQLNLKHLKQVLTKYIITARESCASNLSRGIITRKNKNLKFNLQSLPIYPLVEDCRNKNNVIALYPSSKEYMTIHPRENNYRMGTMEKEVFDRLKGNKAKEREKAMDEIKSFTQCFINCHERKRMTINEKRNLFEQYKHDALFCQWLPTLNTLFPAGQGGEVEIWNEVKWALHRLRQETDWHEKEVQFLYTDLCDRYPSIPLFNLTVMTALLTCLAESAPCVNRADKNPYAPICVSICSMLDGDKRFHTLLNAFFNHSHNIFGNQMILPITDYLADEHDEEVTEEIIPPENGVNILRQMVDNALELDDIPHLMALELRLYKLDNTHITQPLIALIDKRIAALSDPHPVNQNNFYDNSNQINQSTLQNPVLNTGNPKKKLTKEKIMNSKNEGQHTVINYINGFQFNECQITNPSFQTIIPNNNTTTRQQDTDNTAKEKECNEGTNLPESLCNPDAQEIMERLCSNNILNEHWQPVGLSYAEKGVLASILADYLNINNLWQTFGTLWHIKPEALRTACNKGMGQKSTQKFMEFVKRFLAN